MSRRLAVALVVGAACGGGQPAQPPPLFAGEGDRDEDGGVLARASQRLLIGDDPAAARRSTADAGTGGDTYGGAYGGNSYASYVPPAWSYPSVNRTPSYNQQGGLTGSIEGIVTWRGAIPELVTSCGPIAPVQIARRGPRTVAGILVYIDHVSVGRVLPHGTGEQRPSTVGGVVVKRGCRFEPSLQLVTPVPAALSIHGDGAATTLRITSPTGAEESAELDAGGRVMLQARTGVTRIESDDRTLGAAWVLGLDSPYFAVTDEAGRFRLDELAPGTYELTFVQPPIPILRDGKLLYGPPVIAHRKVKVGRGTLARVDVAFGD